jgi:hypothetical protein
MTLFSRTTSPSRPRWDGTRVFFEIADGNEQIQCAISRAALEEISEKRCFRTADLLGCFANARGRIERLALGEGEGKARRYLRAVESVGG